MFSRPYLASTELKFINNTRQAVLRYTIFKTENIREIHLPFENDVIFPTVYRPKRTIEDAF